MKSVNSTRARRTEASRSNAGAPKAVLLIRIAVGVVFASEGIQKFLYASEQGAGRFSKIGIPAPELMEPFVGVVETVAGWLVLGVCSHGPRRCRW